MGQVHIARSAAFSNFSTKIDLGFEVSTGIKHVCDLQQGQLGYENASGVCEATTASRRALVGGQSRMLRGSGA